MFIGNNIAYKNIDTPRIIKPLSTGKIIAEDGIKIIKTNIMHEYPKSCDIGLTPIYVQKYIKKKYEVRITVVVENFIQSKINFDNQVDWRKGLNNKYELIDIPYAVKKAMTQMMSDFKIKFGAFDYIVDLNDEWIFLEVNPNGQWQWMEK